MVTLQQSWAGDAEWFVRRHGRYCGEVLYFPHSGRWSGRPWTGRQSDRRPVQMFDNIDAAVAYVASA